MEELDEKIKQAEAEFEGKTLAESQKGEKEKVAVEDLTKKALETLAETKKRKQQEGEEVKQTKMSRTTILGYNNLTVFAHHPKPDQSEFWLVS